ncbi:hypothetical protein ACFJGV_16480 [Cnuibacter sp. UC19_7]|uniref:hypothetical protein n=1 Tax=Cnuibacter sp. UC19_7 TaxID=3350166 RepID=UPI0036713876
MNDEQGDGPRRPPRWLPTRHRRSAVIQMIVWAVVAGAAGLSTVTSLRDGEPVEWLRWVAIALPLALSLWHAVAAIYYTRRPNAQT